MEFKTKIIIDGDFKGSCDLTWHVDLECRSWGVKSILVYAPDQEITFYNTREALEGEEGYEDGNEIEEEITMKLEDIDCETPYNDGMICPETLHIEKDGGRINVILQ